MFNNNLDIARKTSNFFSWRQVREFGFCNEGDKRHCNGCGAADKSVERIVMLWKCCAIDTTVRLISNVTVVVSNFGSGEPARPTFITLRDSTQY